jgi:hypothetical protein
MNLIAWSQNLTPEAAKAAGAILVSKDQLFEQADILTIHLVLSSRTRDLVGAAELERMKPTARLINAARRSTYSTLSRCLHRTPSGRWATYWQRRISATYRRVFTRRSTRTPSQTFGSGSTPSRHETWRWF